GRTALGNDDPVEIKGVHEQVPTGDTGDQDRGLLDLLRQERHKGDEEVADHEEGNGVEIPVAGVAHQKELRLLGDVGIPDQEELGEGDVGPEDDEGVHQFPHQVIVLDGDDLGEVARTAQQRQQD